MTFYGTVVQVYSYMDIVHGDGINYMYRQAKYNTMNVWADDW